MRKKSFNNTEELVVYFSETPLGPLRLCFTEKGLAALEFAEDGRAPESASSSLPPHIQPSLDAARRALTTYFQGDPTALASLTLDPRGTPFQLRVWQELRRIPYGTTISYAELARRVGNPKASRAVGQANAMNPIPLIIPCHRVINADGSLGGYSSGPDRKRWLLRHEGAM
jgi:methylated-DNA-[protein]-cysteine S-methyltransferase